MPCASERSSVIASWRLARTSSIIASASAGSSTTASFASRSLTASDTRCCCAPSCRLRSSLRRSASPAATIRTRDARNSSLVVAQLIERRLERCVELHVVKRETDLTGQLGQHPIVVLVERRPIGRSFTHDQPEQLAAVGDRSDASRCHERRVDQPG